MKTVTSAQKTKSIVAVMVAVLTGVSGTARAVVQQEDTTKPTPRQFCIDGVVWESRHDVPAVAREYDVGERFIRGNQALFHADEVESVILVDAQLAHNSRLVQTDDTVRVAIQESRAEKENAILWLPSWFFVPQYDAFLVEQTNQGCERTESDLFLGRITERSQSALERAGGDGLQFIVETNASFEGLLPRNPGRD